MRKVVRFSVFVLVIIGTLGLLINEFIFDWGRTATIVFAAFNVAGLATLAFAHWGMKQDV